MTLRLWRRLKPDDEERQPLLAAEENDTATSKDSNYGSINDKPKSQGKQEDEDPRKKLKEQQARRVDEEGGWIPYLKGFTIFLPHMLPKDDWVLWTCIAIRGLDILQERAFNVLEPRQLGIITDKLAQGTTVMPWKDIGLWVFYHWYASPVGFSLFGSYANTVARERMSAGVRRMAYNHVMNLDMQFHTGKSSGEITEAVNQAGSLNELAELALFNAAPVILDIIIAVWYVSHLFDIYMSYIILFVGSVYIWTSTAVTNRNREGRRIYADRRRAEFSIQTETLQNWQTIFYFNREAHEVKRYGVALMDRLRAYYAFMRGLLGGFALVDLVMNIGFTACFIFAISQVVAGLKPVGNLVSFVMFWWSVRAPIQSISYHWKTLSTTLIDAERLLELIRTKPLVDDAPNARPLKFEVGKVEYSNVDFAYDERKPILKNVSFTIEGGQTAAFVGETGSGKSTIFKLLARAYDVGGGSISVDDQDIRTVTRSSLREIIGHVPQDPALFNLSIMENVRYGRLDATDAEIEDACRAAAIHDDIIGFPDGYESVVGERGVKLSGGQLQRIAIAKVLIRNAKIVLLDEATSAVDSTTEALIQKAFKTLSAGRTTLVIAHRLSTIVQADQIFVVSKGEIIERGTHAELLAKNGKYAELWSTQTGSVCRENCGDGDKDKGMKWLVDISPEKLDKAGATGSSSSQNGKGKEVKKRG
ncbi:P-loop containing nucleoside triphosphate hydrolase protein [Sporormia fimetaria CBS 119925]|uniref:P-loop containing nucleoside triphosphate hydrolase protein n=1 Tax=Sporormia fimetaria CBS 119925 TaxID=1340428 RepID=A0A6A6V806_9PLEO|nr:P-loop containing nucleoside triphosphate hydrolase protein [Sporormia fimetaria CBS 119925]